MNCADNKKTPCRFKKGKVIALIVLAFSISFFFISLRLFNDDPESDPYREWLEIKKEPQVGLIRIWHIAEIKPYVGSLSSWLSKQAGAYKDRFIGVYFDVRVYTLEDALERLNNGDRPDIISFPEGSLEASGFADVIAYSVPYCATGSFVVFDPVKAADTPVEEMAASAGSPEAFKKGKCFSCVCDIRGLGDLERAQLAGKCPYFEAEPYPEAGFKYQSIGYFSGVSVEKNPYISGFIEHISNTAAQGSLCSIGLLPVNAGSDIGFEIEAIRKLYESFCETAIRETL